MPPNILWIVTTQWREQAFGFAGDPNARTPRIDRLAAGSLTLSQAVTPHPFGPFARAALLTGVTSPANGVVNYYDPLPVGARTVAHRMRDRGYFTAYMGKWHLAERDRQASLTGDVHARMVVPEERRGGFDFWEGFEGGFLLNNPWLHGTEIPEPVRFEGYQSDVVCGRAARRLPTLPEPWFSVVSLEAPHPPYAAPAGGVAPRDPESLVLRQNVQGTSEAVARARRELSGYYAHGEATDRAVGGLLDALPGDTIIVFTSVHGDMHGSHGLFRKGWPHEESIRVPLLVRYPGAGGVSHRPTSLDELAGFALHWAEHGARGPLPEPAANACRVSMPSVVRLPDQCDRVWTAIREPGRKLVIDGGGKPWLYFDLERDPFEVRNLVDDPTRAAEIRGMLAQA